MDLRFNAKNTLKKYINSEKNVEIIEKAIYILSQQKNGNYLNILYMVCYLKNNGILLKDILNDIKTDNLGYTNKIFDELNKKQREKNDYLENPFEIVEGVVNCKKCGSNKTISSTKMDRASDEPLSIYAQCINCKHKWRENN